MNFTLRCFNTNDLHNLVKYANNLAIAKNMTNQFPHPYSIENGKSFIEFATSKTPNHILAIDLNGEVIGALGIHQQTDIHCNNAELGYWLAEPFWGKGIISKAIPQMVEYGFNNFAINRIFARPFGTNIPSQKALEKSGFFLEAKFEKSLLKDGELMDELIYTIHKK